MNSFAILEAGVQAEDGTFVVRKLSDDHFKLEDSGTEIKVLGNDMMAVHFMSRGKPMPMMPDSAAIVETYSCKSSRGRWYDFWAKDGELVVMAGEEDEDG